MSARPDGLTQLCRSPSGMTWEMIEAERAARVAGTVVTRPLVPAVRLKRAPKPVAVVAFAADARLASNLAAHVERPRPVGALTKGQAAKFRKATMTACPCRLCALALRPPQTFAEVVAFGLSGIAAESDDQNRRIRELAETDAAGGRPLTAWQADYFAGLA